ncbi:YhgE/Pip domain-containing protein [Cohnella endophytica]|uniref:YhgE/Pip domain-containing protein n=1 Tax=Cohnella endophytica TaxID=2419778 RepID=A0A494YBM0_9BACL|nr:YhgE/Pip domain-containing protein [Cohnella endophytica]RKP58056.1 YhgE/Pip domain-containing protein [Cohnella endophytica]
MKSLRIFKQSFANFIRRPMMVLSFVAVAFVPILYCGFLIRGTWNPYGQLNELPVAIVNLDKGTISQGKTMNVGQDFIQELKNNASFDWNFVSESEAEQGMKGNHYYASITIPPNFSEKVASLSSDRPQQAEMEFESNSYYNFVAGQISENATKELRERLSHNLTEAYSRSIYAQFESLSGGLSAASEGATQLHTGAIRLDDGLKQLAMNMSVLAAGTGQLNSKTGSLVNGADKLSDGASQLGSGASELAAGARKLSDAGNKLEIGASTAERGAAALKKGIESAKDGADRMTSGIQSAATGSKQLKEGLSASISGIEALTDGSGKVAKGLQQAMDANKELADNPQLKELLAASQAVSTSANDLLAAQKKLLAGSQGLDAGQQNLMDGSRNLSGAHAQLLQGATELQAGQKQLSDGIKTYNANFSSLVTGSDKLAQGGKQVNSGAKQLSGGLRQMADGIASASSGAAKLDSGAKQLSEGAVQLANGSGELDDKLGEAASSTSKLQANDEMIKMLAQPVAIKTIDERKVTIYGFGIAPYFISMALFAGALVFTTIVSARQSLVEGAGGFPLFFTKMLTFGLLSLAQSLIVVIILVYALGVKVQSVPLFFIYTAIVGLTFMFVVQAIVTWLDLPGRFVVLLLMIFQLTSSAGTFPLELLPGWAKAMNPLFPMTYSIRGFRDVISSGDFGHMWLQAARLGAYLIVFLLLTLVYFLSKGKKTDEEQLMPVKV